jgi:hypothetical protein
MTTGVAAFRPRLPVSLKAALHELAERDGTSLNQFLVIASAEKLSAMQAAEFFATRRSQVDPAEFRRLQDRDGGEPPRPEDSLD